ncbi:hypothetical protein B0H13DRAFT_1879937 [Mycena leptocephala]|nr:hypothetical protein B0H13DRAFT_1879937 [Mycena leptocephala]
MSNAKFPALLAMLFISFVAAGPIDPAAGLVSRNAGSDTLEARRLIRIYRWGPWTTAEQEGVHMVRSEMYCGLRHSATDLPQNVVHIQRTLEAWRQIQPSVRVLSPRFRENIKNAFTSRGEKCTGSYQVRHRRLPAWTKISQAAVNARGGINIQYVEE